MQTCPRAIISLVRADCPIYLGCSTHGRGKAVKDICAVGCIACGQCARKDPNEAIQMVDFLPVLDFEKSHDLLEIDLTTPGGDEVRIDIVVNTEKERYELSGYVELPTDEPETWPVSFS